MYFFKDETEPALKLHLANSHETQLLIWIFVLQTGEWLSHSNWSEKSALADIGPCRQWALFKGFFSYLLLQPWSM